MSETPFEKLLQRYGPDGEGSRKPCPLLLGAGHGDEYGNDWDCPQCGGSGTVLDAGNPFSQALWEECWDCAHGLPLEEGCGWAGMGCHGAGLIPRSRAEAALGLPDAAQNAIGAEFQNYTYREDGRVLCELFNKDFGVIEEIAEGEAGNPLDALSAAILAKEGVKP